jgi:hypothetical protein
LELPARSRWRARSARLRRQPCGRQGLGAPKRRCVRRSDGG